MKIRDAVFLVIGGLLVISGMVLNSFLVDDADAQDVSLGDMTFGYITCEGLIIKDGDKRSGLFGLDTTGDAMLKIYGDDGKTPVAYLGGNPNSPNGEMNFIIRSKSKTDKRGAIMAIDENGGRLDTRNKLGEAVVRIGVGSDGGGSLDLRDKHGYIR